MINSLPFSMVKEYLKKNKGYFIQFQRMLSSSFFISLLPFRLALIIKV